MKAFAGNCDTCNNPAVTLIADHGHEVRDKKTEAFRTAQLCRRCIDEVRCRRAKGLPDKAAPPRPATDPRQLDMFAPSLGLALALEPARGRR